MAEWITVSTASRRLNVAERTVRHYISESKLIAKKEKGKWLIDDDSIGKLLAADSATPASASTIAVPVEHYDGLTIRVGQLQAENDNYRRMLQAHDNEVEKYEKQVQTLEAENQRYKSLVDYYRLPWYKKLFHTRQGN